MIYENRCKDCNLDFKTMEPQFLKFKQQVQMVCVNRKIVLREMNLGLNFSKAFVNLIQNQSRYSMDKIASIDLSKNQLRDEGVIELSKILFFTKSLVKLDLSSNEITPKAI
jgi:Ran GTPase-activating protein (RanGAP) involved in mRNA processing and transport